MEDIHLLIVISQNHTCQGGKNEFLLPKLCFQLLLKCTGMIQATIHKIWEDLRYRLFLAKKFTSAINGLLVMFLRVYSCCLSIFNK